jgi:hypothetical protein
LSGVRTDGGMISLGRVAHLLVTLSISLLAGVSELLKIFINFCRTNML